MKRCAVLMLSLLAGTVQAQVIDKAPPRDPPPEQPRPSGGGGGIGFGFSFSFGSHKPKPPPVPAWETADAAISDHVAGELVVVMTGTALDAARIARMAKVSLIDFAPIEALGESIAVIALGADDTAEAANARLARQTNVVWVQPNNQFQPLGGRLPDRYTLIGLSRAEQLRVSGTLAMIDTPVDTASSELHGAQISQVIFGTSAIPAAHGTAIASIMVGTGEVQGIAQGARLVSLAAFDPDAASGGISQTRAIAKAMDAAWKLRPDVLNLSFGGREDRLLSALLIALDRRGVCMVGAVGNGGPQSAVLFPARHPSVLAVTAADEHMQVYSHAAQGPQVAITGIGVGLLASVPGGYRMVSGTSFATATVSGALMHVNACTGLHDPAAMRAFVAAQALDLGARGRDPVFGAGLMRLAAVKK